MTTNEDVEMEDAVTEKILAITSDKVTAAYIQTVYTTQRIKANTCLIKKLSKEREHSEEVYRIISNDNIKLKFEIAQSQKVINCMLMALETVKMTNLDLERECLIAKQKKKDVIERAQNGEKKYEDLWLECKARYEGLPYMKNLLNAKDEVKNLEHKIAELDNNEQILRTKIKAKTKSSFNRERIVQLADFMINQMPKNIHLFVEKSAAIKKITKELEKLEAKAIANIDNEKAKEKGVDCVTSDGSLKLRKLMLSSLDFGDMLSVKHDKDHQSAEELEDTVMTASNAEMLLMPPTQFLDVTTVLVSDKQKEEEIVPPLRSPPKEIQSSSQTLKNLQKSEDAIVTSKFFHQEQNSSQADPAVVEKISAIKNTTIINELADAAKTTTTPSHINIDSRKSVIEMDVDYPNVIPNPIMQNINKKNQSTASKTVSGYESILSHGTKFMTESLDSSITMDYDDVEAGLQHCIDSNLLLSPKADFTQGSEKPEKLSENLPSFMSGMRKAGLSFFGSETKTESSAQNQGGSGFNFNFGGGEKKTRGGLFNLFQ